MPVTRCPTELAASSQSISRLQAVLIAFLVLAYTALVVSYAIRPSLFIRGSPAMTKTALLFGAVFSLEAFVAAGVLRRWRWMFWIILLAFGLAPLRIPFTLLQLTGVLSGGPPVWYGALQIMLSSVQFAIAFWMLRIYRRRGAWGRG